MSDHEDLEYDARFENAMGQMDRYGIPHYDEVIEILEVLTDLNDDTVNMRHPDLVVEGVQRLKKAADDLARKYCLANPGSSAAPKAPAVAGDEQQPVSWQFYQDGKWWNGDDRIKDHRKNTEAAGIPVRDLYAAPVEQQPVGVVDRLSVVAGKTTAFFDIASCPIGTKLYAAPIAQTPAFCFDHSIKTRTATGVADTPSDGLVEALSGLPDVCDGLEQEAFEDYARKEGMDMRTHPLHWLFLDKETYAARKGWRAAIRYCREALAAHRAGQAQSQRDGGDE